MCEIKRKVILNNVFPNARYMTAVDNLGHETINLFKADNGFYLHLNANGTYQGEEPVDVLNVSYVGKGLYQVMSKAVHCTVMDEAKKSGSRMNEERYNGQKEAINYDGIPIYKFFESNVTMQGEAEKDLFATFKCKCIVEPQESIFLAFKDSDILADEECGIFKLKDKIKFSSICRIVDFSDDDSKVLNQLISSKRWKGKENKEKEVPAFLERYEELKKMSLDKEENYLSFLGVDKQELQYSNALIKILKFNPKFLSAFLHQLSDVDCTDNEFDILREEKSIDLLFRDLDKKNGKIFIIENKIDANITLSEYKMTIEEQIKKWFDKIENIGEKNKRTDEQDIDIKFRRILQIVNKNLTDKDKKASQLSKYYIIAVYWAIQAGWNDEKIEKDIYCYFLCPEYHRSNYKVFNKEKLAGKLDSNFALSEKYKLITYRDVLEIFNNFSKERLSPHQVFLLDDFISAISILAKERDDAMELKMIRLFIERYEKIKNYE